MLGLHTRRPAVSRRPCAHSSAFEAGCAIALARLDLRLSVACYYDCASVFAMSSTLVDLNDCSAETRSCTHTACASESAGAAIQFLAVAASIELRGLVSGQHL